MARLTTSFFFSWVLLGQATAPARAEEPMAVQANPAADEVAYWVQQLDAATFQQRRMAFLKLWQFGPAALPQVQQAARSAHLHVAQPAAVLERLLLLGIAHDAQSEEVIGHVLQPTAEGVVVLCRHGLWDLAEHLVSSRPLLAAELFAEEDGTVLGQISQLALEQGHPELAWRMVRWTALPQDDDTDRGDLSVWLAAKLDLPLPPQRQQEVDVRALHAAYAGDPQAAWEMGPSEAVQRLLVTRFGLWERLEDPGVRLLLLGSTATPAGKASEAVLLELAGQYDPAKRIWEQLLGPAPPVAGQLDADHQPEQGRGGAGQPGVPIPASTSQRQTQAAVDLLRTMSPFERPRFILSLLMSGRPEPVMEYLQAENPQAAFGFAVAGLDYDAALRSVGLSPDLENFDQWLAERESLIRLEVAQPLRGNEVFSETARVCSLLAGLGLRQQASELLEMLAEKAGTREDMWSGPASIISWMGRGEQRTLALSVLEPVVGQLPTETESYVLARLFDQFPSSATALARTAPQIHDEQGRPIGLLTLLDHLHRWDRQYFAERSGTGTVPDWLRRAEIRVLADPQLIERPDRVIEQLAELARLAAGCGCRQLAYEFATMDVRRLGVLSEPYQVQWLEAARLFQEDGHPEQAVEVLERLRRSGMPPTEHLPLLREIRCLLLAGRYDEAIQVELSRWLRPLSSERYYGTASYAQLADALNDQFDYVAAWEYAEPSLLLSAYGDISSYWAAADLSTAAEELERFGRGADAWRGVLIEGLQPRSSAVFQLVSRGYHSSLRFAVERERLYRTIDCVQRGAYDEAQHHMEIAARLNPQDIEVVVQCYPRLRAAGQQAMATEWFERYERTLLAQIERWPNDPTAKNNLAWMYARCQEKLDRALDLATQAVALAPESAVYLDTLAEVHYRAGRVSEALELMHQCVRLDPRTPHYRQNLERFINREP
ncbi:MAG: hypothetical protein KatS3mg111_1821 [Pirellulaceae bacterium]|nr:MAG: hypothetical protein KatS3mg111_1821 [Pirellulaceae bacterium]